MKKALKTLAVSLLGLLLVSCGVTSDDVTSDIESDDTTKTTEENKLAVLEKPKDTNLDFWITQHATYDDIDIDKYDVYNAQELGFMGSSASYFFSKKYESETYWEESRNGDTHQHKRPIKGVMYRMESYDACRAYSAITGIEIEDPDATIYGLTINSRPDQFIYTMKTNGFDVKEYNMISVARYENIFVQFQEHERILMYADFTFDSCPGWEY